MKNPAHTGGVLHVWRFEGAGTRENEPWLLSISPFYVRIVERGMKKAIFIPILLFGFGVAAASPAAGFSVRLSNTYPTQGDTVMISVTGSASAPLTATLGDQTANFFSFGGNSVAVLGLKVTAQTGWQSITVRFAGGPAIIKRIDVFKKQIVTEKLEVPPSLGVTAPQLIQGLKDENAVIGNIVAAVTPQSYVTRNFGLPLADNRYITDRYGILRKTGDQGIWHLGTDFAAAPSTAVGAMNAGVVRFATSTFSYGNMVIVDHGEGIYSMYLHMNKILVTVGQAVRQGQTLGLVGDTGFSTGDHLHLSIKINGISVDPLQFVQIFR